MANLFSIPSPNSINMANFVTIKLSAESYIAWREQVTGMAGLFHISGFLTGQTPPPQQYKPKPPNTDDTTINAADDTHSSATHTDEQEETNEYVAWKQTDLFLRSLLIGTMSPEVLTLATGHSTTKDLWYALEQEFARSSYQRSFTLLQQVRNLKKDNSTSVSNHVRQFKVLSDKLAIIDKPLDDDDKVQYLLMSLPSSYKDFVTMMMKPPTPTYTECVSQLISYEDRCLLFDSSTDGTYAFATHTTHNNSHNGGEKPKFTSQGKGFGPATEQPNTSNVSSSFDLNALAKLLQQVSNTGQSSNQSSGSNYRPQQGLHNRGQQLPYTRNQSQASSRNDNRGVNKPPPPGCRRMTAQERELYRNEVCQLCGVSGHVAKICWNLQRRSSGNLDLPQALAALTLDTSLPDTEWIADTGASTHMAHNPGLFSYLQTYLGPDFVIVGNGHKLNILGIGNIPVTDGKHHILLKDVLLVPQLTRNLLSIHQLNNHYDASCEFTKEMFCVKERQTGKTLLIGKRKGELYILPKAHSALITHVQSASETTWHQRLGHPQSSSLHSLASKGLISLGSSSINKELCSSCCLGKMSKLSFPQSTNKSTSSFDTVHCDLWGPAPVPSLLGSFRYYALFVDDFSRYMWFTPMKTRDEFFDVYIAFEKYVFRQFSKQIKVFHSDNGGEFINRKLASHFQRHGIVHQLSCPHTPEQMGRVERRHRIIRELGMTMLFHSGVPTHFWPESFATAVFLINRLPSSALSFVSPYFRLFESHPVYSFLRVFGCRCYPYVWDRRQNKFSPKSVPCVFLGYCNRQKGFKCFHPSTRKIIVSRHVKFDETILPYQGTYPSSTALSPFLNDALTFPDPEPSSVELLPLPTSSLMCPSLSLAARPIAQHANTFTSQSLPTGLIPLSPQSPAPAFELYPSSPSPCHSGSVHSRSPSHSPSALPLDTPISSSALGRSPPTYVSDPQAGVSASPPTTSIPTDALVHPMITRRRNGIVKPNPKYALTVSYAHIPEIPRSTQSAVRHDGWRQAMLDELAALHHNSTWTLVPRHPRQHVIGCKWVYKAKLHANGSLERLKARLVAKGFHQVDGIDFHETYSPVIKPTTVRVLLSVALVSGWQVRQLDVKNAFLHGHITEDIYMEQPPGFADRQHPHHVYKLHRALYGLRQAPRAWFDRFSTFLLKLGFYCSFADSSLFVSNSSAGLIVLILYVDDMLITGSNPDHIDRFVSVLRTEFSMKDLGPVHHFLGIEVQHNDQGLLLVQSHFASTILDKAQMLDCKPQRTPLPSKVQQPANSPLLPDPTFYRTLIGSLQYLTFTRPDIAFAVNFAAQFSQCPTLFSLSLVRRILRYIKGTLSLGMQFSTASSLDLCAFSDSDWGGCITTRRSTTGFCTFLGRNLISWCAKKQPTISRSSTEAEYRAMAHTAAELTWLTYLLRDFGITRPRTPLLLCDNISALHMTVNPVFHARTKHIEIDYHFVRERVAHGSLITRHIASHLQLADVFTKPQSKASLASIRTKLCLLPRHNLRADNNSTLEWSHKDGRRDKEATQVRTPTSDMSPSSTKTDEQCVSDKDSCSTQSETNED